MADADTDDRNGFPRHKLIGLVLGPLAAVGVIVSPPPAGLSQTGWWIAGIGLWMALWWMTEALPLAVTALLPLIAFPFLGLRGIEATAPAYAHPLIFLFLGGFLLARALHAWELDRRIALTVLRYVGASPRGVIFGLMAVTAFLSMWVSNTATTMVMLPIGLSIVSTFGREGDQTSGGDENVAPALLLGIAYAGLGRNKDAVREGRLALELLPISRDAWRGIKRVKDLARIYVMVGEYDKAIDQLEVLLLRPGWMSIPLLRLDPAWDPLRDHPRFQKLLESDK